MALYEVKDYYYKMQRQYLEMKNDLADYEQAVRDGNITEEQLESIKEEIAQLEDNYHRLSYVMHLLEVPNRKYKKIKFLKANKDLINYFKQLNADTNSVVTENESTLEHIRAKLKELTNKNK